MKHEDKHGEWIFLGDTVNVDEPTSNLDPHNCAFTGTVINVKENYVTVQDLEENCYDLEPAQMEVQLPIDDEAFGYIDYPEICTECGIGEIRFIMVNDNVGHDMHEEVYCPICGIDD